MTLLKTILSYPTKKEVFMKKFPLFLSLLLFLCNSLYSQNSHGTSMAGDSGHIVINQKDLKWMDGPPTLPKGAKLAVLEGDPSKEGMFTLRLIFPANYQIAPHWHPTAEHVTVIEGEFYMGSGEKFDEKNAMMLTPGGYATMPTKFVHFAFTKAACIVQVHAMGPFAINYVNPADDPRKK
jgi:Domain of unknown function (DUF4437)